MTTFSYPISNRIRCSSSNRYNLDPIKQKLSNIKITVISMSSPKVDLHTQNAGVATTFSSVPFTENGYISKEKIRQNIPTKKQFVDPHRQGLITERGVGYRQTVVVRSYEVGADKTATLESILNLLQVLLLRMVENQVE